MTFCIAVEAQLNTDVCPLPKGRCYWQHRETRQCCYTEHEIAPTSYCLQVGANPASEQELAEFKIQLRVKL